jgi:hypothetical protein
MTTPWPPARITRTLAHWRIRSGTAGFAAPEHLEPVIRNLEVGALAQFFEERGNSAVLELHDGTAVRADQVMMMTITRHRENIGMATIGAMYSVEHAVLDEDIERAKDGRATDIGTTARQLPKQLVGCECPVKPLGRFDYGPPRRCHPVT